MKQSWLAVATCLLLTSVGGSAQTAPRKAHAAGQARLVHQERREPRANVERMKADIQFLSSDAVQGRRTISPESAIVAEWLANEFHRYGLKPAGKDYFQHFTVSSAMPANQRSGLRLETTSDGQTVSKNLNAGMAQAAQPTDIEVSGPVAFAGYGISAPEYGYDDYAGFDAKGKVLLVIDHEPAEDRADSPLKGTSNTRYAYRIYKQQEAKRRGAVALLILAGEGARHIPPAPQDPERRSGTDGAVQNVASLEPIPTRFLPEADFNELLKPSGKNVADLRKQIDATVKPQSFDVTGQRATVRSAAESRTQLDARNVVGVIEGSDSKLKNEYVVVTAHFDHLGVREARIYHGADDNASGTAAMLEVMRMFRENRPRLRRSVMFVGLEAEEKLMVGSMGLLADPPVPLASVVADVNADMVGRDEDTYRAKPEEHTNSVNIVGTLYSPDVRAIVERRNREVGLTLDYKMDRNDSENMFGRSDQYSFALKNIPAVLFMTGFHRDYHTARDTWEKLNYPKMEKIATLMYLTTLDLANAAQRPRWVQ